MATKPPNLNRDTHQTRAYLRLLAKYPDRMAQGQLAKRISVPTRKMRNLFDSSLFEKDTTYRPSWRAKPGPFADSIAAFVWKTGARLSKREQKERELLRQWVLDSYLPLFKTTGLHLDVIRRFDSVREEISIMSATIEVVRERVETFADDKKVELGQAWDKVAHASKFGPDKILPIVNLLRRIPGMHANPERFRNYAREYERTYRNAFVSLAGLPVELRERLVDAEPDARDAIFSVASLFKSSLAATREQR